MAGRAAIRASDADREQIADRLRRAAGEGRLRTEELEHRLEAALGARTYGQLDAVVADLPGRRRTTPSRALALRPRGPLGVALAAVVTVAVLVTALFLATGVFTGWLLWLVCAWLFTRARKRRGCARGLPAHGRPRGYSA